MRRDDRLVARHRDNRRDRHEGHHVHREIVRVAEDPADGAGQTAAFDDVDAARVVEDAARRDVPDAER